MHLCALSSLPFSASFATLNPRQSLLDRITGVVAVIVTKMSELLATLLFSVGREKTVDEVDF